MWHKYKCKYEDKYEDKAKDTKAEDNKIQTLIDLYQKVIEWTILRAAFKLQGILEQLVFSFHISCV